MVLGNKDWKVLYDAGGEPISLELLSFNHVVWSLRSYGTQIESEFLIKGHGVEDTPINFFMNIHERGKRAEKCPPGHRQLDSCITKTHFFSRSLSSRTDPLIQANGQLCTAGRRGRAGAIMSSPGVSN